MKVCIINGGLQYTRMFLDMGWTVVSTIEDCDLIQFTGGADVNPGLYGEKKHPKSFTSPERDNEEALIYEYGYQNGIPMAGICRGGQFLNVMSGGAMYQHVNNHGINGTHVAYDQRVGGTVHVTSTHHQMMIPSGDYELVLTADLATVKQYMGGDEVIDGVCNEPDVESVYYPQTRCLCYQPHPEFPGYDECRDHYFECLSHYLGLEVKNGD